MMKKMKTVAALLLALVISICAPIGVFADTSSAEFINEVAMAPTDGSRTEITLSDDVTLEEPITIKSGQTIVLRADEETTISGSEQLANAKGMFIVEDGGSLILSSNVTVDADEYSRVIYVNEGGSLAVEEGAVIRLGTVSSDGGGIYNNGTTRIEGEVYDCEAGGRHGGGVYNSATGELTVSGNAIIAGNLSNYYGGGISNFGQMTLEGGTIKENKAEWKYNTWVGAGGGGIYSSGTFLMTGGVVEDNTCVSMGGGIHIDIKNPQYECRISGGVIRNNSAIGTNSSAGGGIYILSRDSTGSVSKDHPAYIEACEIYGNTATNGLGGGIYLARPEDKLVLTNTIITENTASRVGGGLWLCETGSVEVFVTNGAAIINNETNADPSCGDDIAFIRNENSTEPYTLSSRILGGGKVTYYNDGGYSNNEGSYGKVDPEAERYEPDHNTSVWDGTSEPGIALHAVASDADVQKANDAATVRIYNNHAKYGGGVGGNGIFTLGSDEPEIDISFEKVWKFTDGNEVEIPETISVELLINGEETGEIVEISAEDNWKGSFKGLPLYDENEVDYEYSIKEHEVKGFTAAITGNMEDGYTITNTQIPDKPTDSDDAEEPDEPTPSEDEDTPDESDSPDTGDESDLPFMMTLFALSLSGVASMAAYRRRYRDK